MMHLDNSVRSDSALHCWPWLLTAADSTPSKTNYLLPVSQVHWTLLTPSACGQLRRADMTDGHAGGGREAEEGRGHLMSFTRTGGRELALCGLRLKTVIQQTQIIDVLSSAGAEELRTKFWDVIEDSQHSLGFLLLIPVAIE
ncbi:hypothetical protein JZ751_025158 [Albula glossodonta]|uniref:Uncharacterized protein n=1 Tax=Albula glossodonta TaxID=121402 RepID=A0A8T2PHR6_9TELE|nr:hypothetical protein JZ751_025158 [Albula glossodonta]